MNLLKRHPVQLSTGPSHGQSLVGTSWWYAGLPILSTTQAPISIEVSFTGLLGGSQERITIHNAAIRYQDTRESSYALGTQIEVNKVIDPEVVLLGWRDLESFQIFNGSANIEPSGVLQPGSWQCVVVAHSPTLQVLGTRAYVVEIRTGHSPLVRQRGWLVQLWVALRHRRPAKGAS